ncbi:MAG: carboxypeptidase-like regulatory domain-containing protein [Flavobacteriaceae bacterium]
MKYWLTFLFALSFVLVAAQEKRQLLKGTLLYRNTSVIAANVVNNTAQTNTITDDDGNFEILAKAGDEIIFSSVAFRIKALTITPQIIQKNRLVVEVNERITILDEIVVGPENTQKFLDLKKEEFSKVDYTQDKSTKIDNTIIRQGQLVNGLNIVNVAKLLAKVIQGRDQSAPKTLVPSKVLPLIFDNTFFTSDLGLEQNEVVGFLEEMDKKLPSDRLLKKDKEFQLIEFLYLQSEEYKKQIR